MRPNELLEMFSVDMDSKGAEDFLELTYRIAAAWREPNAKRECCAEIVTMMCKQRGTWYMPFYATMRRAVNPVLEADDDTLRELGVDLKKRTSSGLAYALAPWVYRGI